MMMNKPQHTCSSRSAPCARHPFGVRWLGLSMALLLAFILGALVPPADVARAQAPAEVDEGDDDAPLDDEALRRKIMERIRVVRAIKLTETLDLDDATGKKLFAILDSYDERLVEGHKTVRQAQRKLRRGMRSGASDAQIEAGLDAVIDARKRLDALRYERFDAASAVLSPRQRVKLMKALPKLEREIRRRVRDAQRGERGGRERRRQRDRKP